MKRALLPVSLLLLSMLAMVPAFAAPMTPVWLNGQHYGSTGIDVGLAEATDAAGNTYVTGYITGNCTFGGSNLTSQGAQDIFIAKYDKTGAHVWSKNLGEPGNDVGQAIAVDASGNVYVTGYFSGVINLGGVNLTSAGSNDLFIAKFSGVNGNHIWSFRYGGINADSGNGIAVDGAANVYVTGTYSNTVDFGGGGLTSLGSTDIFLAKFNTAGAHLWSRSFGSSGADIGYAVATDAASNVILTGNFNGSVNFGGSTLVSAGLGDIVLAKYSSTGTHLWSQSIGNASDDAGLAVATDAASNVVLCGYTRLSQTIGSDFFPSSGDADFLIAKFNPSGTYQWARLLTSVGLDAGYAVATDAAGNVYATGTAGGNMQIGTTAHTWFGGRDICLVKYDTSGNYQWSMVTGTANDDNGLGIAVDPSRHVHVTGYYSNGADVGGGNMTSNGVFDFFFANYSGGGSQPGINAVVDVGNDQGRLVRIDFNRTGRDDALSSTPVISYEAYRRNDSPPAFVTGQQMTPGQLLLGGWTQVGSVGAHGEDHYSINVPTVGDSTLALGQYLSVFYIRASTSTPTTFYDSAPDSGYSVDNLAPGVPASFVFNTGSLTWNESTAPDFDYFTVYGSNVDSFANATLVNYTTGRIMNVTGSPYTFYYVTATDFSGNEGRPAKVNTLSGIGGTPQSYVLSVSNYPNPFNPRTTVKYTVPGHARVSVRVFDATGAYVATLFEGERKAGAYSVEWDGHAASGATVGSGVYFVRIEQNGATRTAKMVLLK